VFYLPLSRAQQMMIQIHIHDQFSHGLLKSAWCILYADDQIHISKCNTNYCVISARWNHACISNKSDFVNARDVHTPGAESDKNYCVIVTTKLLALHEQRSRQCRVAHGVLIRFSGSIFFVFAYAGSGWSHHWDLHMPKTLTKSNKQKAAMCISTRRDIGIAETGIKEH